jgi:hypothetical protein
VAENRTAGRPQTGSEEAEPTASLVQTGYSETFSDDVFVIRGVRASPERLVVGGACVLALLVVRRKLLRRSRSESGVFD